MEGHSANVTCVAFHPELPLIVSGSEDATVKLWHADTRSLASNFAADLGRCWTLACSKGGNTVALGFDHGTLVIKVGKKTSKGIAMQADRFSWARKERIRETMHDPMKPLVEGKRANYAAIWLRTYENRDNFTCQ